MKAARFPESLFEVRDYNKISPIPMPSDDARSLLDRMISEHRQAHFRFESADCSLMAQVDGFIGHNAVGELLITSNPSESTASFKLKLGLDFVCDYADVTSRFPCHSQAIRLRFTNGDILLVLQSW